MTVKKQAETTQNAAFQKQCFLANNAGTIINHVTALKMAKYATPLTAIATNMQRSAAMADYKYFSYLNSPGPVPGHAPQIMTESQGSLMLNRWPLPAILNKMKVRVEFYKIFPNLQKGGLAPIEIKLPISMGDRAMPTGTLTTDDEAHFAQKKNQMRGYSNIGQATMKNVKFSLAGSTYAEVRTVDTFTFQVVFQNWPSLVHEYTRDVVVGGITHNLTYSNKDLFAPASFRRASKTAPTNVPVLAGSPCMAPFQAQAATKDELDPRYFEIVAKVFYEYPESKDLRSAIIQELSKLNRNMSEVAINAIVNYIKMKEHGTRVRLSYVQHTIVQDSGVNDATVSINFAFTGFVEQALASKGYDILKTDFDAPEAVAHREAKELLRYMDEFYNFGITQNWSLEDAWSSTLATIPVTTTTTAGTSHAPPGDLAGTGPRENLTESGAELYKKLRQLLTRYHVGPPGDWYAQGYAGAGDSDPAILDSDEISSTAPDGVTAGDHGVDLFRKVFLQAIDVLSYYVSVQAEAVKGARLSTFLQKLYRDGRVMTLPVPKDALGIRSETQVDSARSLAQSRAASLTRIVADFTQIEFIDGPDAIDRAVSDITHNMNPGATNGQEPEDKQAFRQSQMQKIMIDGNNVIVKFVRLGDILDAVIDIATDRQGLSLTSNMEVLMGPIRFRDPHRPTVTSTHNLADIPISWDLLVGFWLKRVVFSGAKKHYLLRNFIEDLVQDVITKALGEECVSRAGFAQSTVGVSNFQTPLTPHPSGDFGGSLGPSPRHSPWFSDPGHWNGLENFYSIDVIQDLERHSIHQPAYSYIFIHVNNSYIDQLPLRPNTETKREELTTESIYHFYTFKTKKLSQFVKQTVFKRASTPFLREARIAGSDYKNKLLVRDVYDATIEFNYGAPFLKPGMVVYLDPSKPGIFIEDYEQLGLGGYYVVTKVDHSIPAGTNTRAFNTSATLRWVTFGAC